MRKRCKLDNLSFSPEFFQDEVREGFYISTMMKRYWASQLKVLSSIAKVCEKHNIKWFADCGTLLGAIRHEGYIPWDDDLDICMLRSDWLSFFEVAEKELPKGFQVLTIQGNDEYEQIIGRVVNSSVIDYGSEHLEEYYGCPYTIGIDIYPLDGLYSDKGKEQYRLGRARKLLEELEIMQQGQKSYSADKKRRLLKQIEALYSECSSDEAEYVALMPFYVPKENHKYPKELFDNPVLVPFENTYVYVPGRFEEVLSIEYGDFMRIRKGGGMHEYPVYADQERTLFDALGRNPFGYNMNYNELLASVQRYVMRLATPVAAKSAKKIVAMLPCRAKWWDNMKPLWRYYKAHDNEYEFHVLPIFYFDCDFAGNIGEKHDERELFPAEIGVEACESFDFAGIHPDIIVAQVPFDGFNTAMTVHEFFYSSNLKQFTDELIYVPCFNPEDPIDENDKAITAIRMLVEQPEVINADRVVVSSEKVKDVYYKRAIELCGAETEMYWQQKIVTTNEYVGDAADSENADVHLTSGTDIGIKAITCKSSTEEWKSLVGDACDKKVVIYYFSMSFILQHREKAIDKISRSIDTFSEAGEGMITIVEPQEAVLTQLSDIDKSLSERFSQLLVKAAGISNIVVDRNGVASSHVSQCSAFYGDRGALLKSCAEAEIPVMIQNVDV